MLVCFLLKLKGLPPGVFDDASNSERTSYHEFENKYSMNVNHVEYKQGFKNDL